MKGRAEISRKNSQKSLRKFDRNEKSWYNEANKSFDKKFRLENVKKYAQGEKNGIL